MCLTCNLNYTYNSRSMYSCKMTRSFVVFVLNFCILHALCKGQANYPIHTVTPTSENDTGSTAYSYISTESPIKFTRKTSTERTSSSSTVRPVYRPVSTTLREDQNEIVQRTSTLSEYSNPSVYNLTATEKTSAFATSSEDPNKFAPPYADGNKAFSETVYREKICKNEPTCDMVKLAPEELTSLGTRNCMCDEDCRKYGDCCLDSPFYNATEQRQNYQSFFCSEQELVYMVTTCPRNYLIDSIKDKCGYFDYESADHDLSLMTPVTSSKYKATFANSYCAVCNGLESFDKWQVALKCSSLGLVQGPTTTVSSVVIFPGANRKKRLQIVRKKSISTTSPPSSELNLNTEAAKYATYDPKRKAFFSTYNGENFKCVHKRTPPDNMKPALRYCYPTIGSCSDFSNRTLVELCNLSATTIVYNKIKYYRNPECALCNKIKDAEPLGCFDLGNRIGASSIFMTGGGNKGGSSPPFCDKGGNRGHNKVC